MEKEKTLGEILGIPEDSNIIVCIRDEAAPLEFDDDVLGLCAFPDCKAPIHWRPHLPPGSHICILCMMTKVPRAEVNINAASITPQTRAEVAEVLARGSRKKRPS